MDRCNLKIFFKTTQHFQIKVNEKVLSLMQRLEPKCAESLKHPKMPNCVKSAVDETVHLFWDDISEMVRFELMIRIEEPQIHLPQRKELCKCCLPWYKFRNVYLYALFPYNKEIWDQIRTFWWWFFKLLQSIPVFGVQPAAFFLLFISIDKSEEFQITNFILNYKNMQFLTSGCMMAMVGFFQYFYCATLYPIGQAKEQYEESRTLQEQQDRYASLEQNQCYLTGPGSHLNIIIDLSTFFFQILLIWIAFILLHFSKSRTEDIENKSLQTLSENKGLKGGRLTYFMIYDLIAFMGTVGMTFLIWYHFYNIKGEEIVLGRYLGPLIYFAKSVYGLLSLPFLVFSVGFFRKLFTKSKPTGYDEHGNVVPIMKQIKLIYEQNPQVEDEPIDIGDLLEKQS